MGAFDIEHERCPDCFVPEPDEDEYEDIADRYVGSGTCSNCEADGGDCEECDSTGKCARCKGTGQIDADLGTPLVATLGDECEET